MTSAQLKIAEDYYFSPLTIAQISEKHSVNLSSITGIANRVDFRRFQEEPEYYIIKVEKSQLEVAKMVLEGNNIGYDVPAGFELTEFYESKINKE